MRGHIRFYLVAFAAGCVLKALLGSAGLDYQYLRPIDPLDDAGARMAIRAMNIWSTSGHGWEGIPSPAATASFWVVFVGIFGLEFGVTAAMLRWLVGRVCSGRRAP